MLFVVVAACQAGVAQGASSLKCCFSSFTIKTNEKHTFCASAASILAANAHNWGARITRGQNRSFRALGGAVGAARPPPPFTASILAANAQNWGARITRDQNRPFRALGGAVGAARAPHPFTASILAANSQN